MDGWGEISHGFAALLRLERRFLCTSSPSAAAPKGFLFLESVERDRFLSMYVLICLLYRPSSVVFLEIGVLLRCAAASFEKNR